MFAASPNPFRLRDAKPFRHSLIHALAFGSFGGFAFLVALLFVFVFHTCFPFRFVMSNC